MYMIFAFIVLRLYAYVLTHTYALKDIAIYSQTGMHTYTHNYIHACMHVDSQK